MKYNSTISLSLARPGLVVGRKTFYGLMSLLLVVLGFFYWLFLHHLTHVGGLSLPRFYSKPMPVSAPVASPATPVTPALKNPVVVTTPSPPPAVRPAIPQTERSPVAAKPVAGAPAARVIVGKGIFIQLPPVATVAQKFTSQPPPQNLTEPEPLLRAGNQAFYNFMDLANSQPDTCGFLPEDNLLHARLGDPIPVYQISTPDRLRYQAGQPVKPLLKPTDRWMFPVYIDSQVRCMLQVVRNGQHYNYVPGGTSKMLGVAWNKILEKWPAPAGFHPLLLVNPEMPGYYFSVPELPEQNITDTDQMIFSPGDLSPAAVILASWR